MELEFLCPDCGRRNEFEPDSDQAEIRCGSCGKNFGSTLTFAEEKTGLRNCGICGCRDLYIQKDFNRTIGCAIVAAGAVLAPFTKLISLLICALIDLILYQFLPLISVCYRCKSIYRGFARNPQHEGFNLGINDRYRSMESRGTEGQGSRGAEER